MVLAEFKTTNSRTILWNEEEASTKEWEESGKKRKEKNTNNIKEWKKNY